MDGIRDYLVIGAGPAGLQLGHLLRRAGRDHVILEAGPGPGTFYRTFPRHRRMISINKPHTGWTDPELNLRMDWNSLLSDVPDLLLSKYTDAYFPHADDYVRYLADYASTLKLDVRCGTRVVNVAKDGHFKVTDQHGEVHEARRVVVATGFGKQNVPAIPGIEGVEHYSSVSVDPDDFTDQRVLILGKGNSAFETADALTERAAVIHVIGPSDVKFAWRTHFIGHLRAVNNNFLDTYQLKTQNMVLDGRVERIDRAGGAYRARIAYARRDKVVTLEYDRVINCTGFRMDASIFDATCRPRLVIDDRFPELTTRWESVNVPDLFFAGTITQSRDFKRFTSAFLHGFRYGVRALHRMLEQRYEGVPWPERELPAEPGALAGAVLERINRTSALWQQYGFLCDVIAVGDGRARYLEELPLDHVPEHMAGEDERDWFTVSLEYGAGHADIDPFDIEAGRAWEADPSKEDRYLHPVVRYYRDGELAGRLLLPEDICNDWSGEEEFREPLRAFAASALAPVTA
ncbi:FAD-dependent oxidoreductase [Actinomadura montaniterrae]|uniref:FAD-dependent oxidoreductase n=1 Tax=Actinomadura montaniterrae TaxID=1803903 RepID=UPI001CEF8835|nr:FAD-dependent oxidoreductase [Actinomadura montaniterrae]